MMEVEDLEVRNVLIDQYHVDTVLLIKTRLEAEQVIEVDQPRGARMVSRLPIEMYTHRPLWDQIQFIFHCDKDYLGDESLGGSEAEFSIQMRHSFHHFALTACVSGP